MELREFIDEWKNESPFIRVHTSGSTGKPKEMLVEKTRMLASAKITCNFLGLKAGDSALLCLPLDYIAGKMMVVRCFERSMELSAVPPSNHPLANTDNDYDLVAMVPSQVYETLKTPEEREKMSKIRNLIIGGGSISVDMERELRTLPNAVWSTYGMTETLSHIALRRINGSNASSWYSILEGVKISIVEYENENTGRLVIDAPFVCPQKLITNDIIEIDKTSNNSRFRILGRIDNVICSGGIKLHIEEIEDRLRPHFSNNFCISKRKEDKFGEVAILLMERNSTLAKQEQYEEALQICRNILPQYSVPKDIIFIDRIPLTGNGKIDRAKAQSICRLE